MQDGNLTAAEQGAICAAWAAIGNPNRETIEAQLLGSVIVGVYPVNSTEATAGGFAKYPAGVCILYRQGNNPEIKTAIIENSCKPGPPEDAIDVLFYPECIFPQESA